MEPGEGLTSRQKQLLELAIKEPYILKTFYLSGGTALSYWYLHHRQSDDLDFFSITPFDYEKIIRWFRYNKNVLGYNDIRFDEDYGFLTVYLHYINGDCLLADFHHYSNTTLQPGITWQGLRIDSLIDITSNKLQTVATLPRTRDYIDLYFISKKKPWNLDILLEITAKKFNEPIDIVQLAKNFLKVTEYSDFPNMLISFVPDAMYQYYERLARSLKSKVLK